MADLKVLTAGEVAELIRERAGRLDVAADDHLGVKNEIYTCIAKAFNDLADDFASKENGVRSRGHSANRGFND